jgi:hypothetical protein
MDRRMIMETKNYRITVLAEKDVTLGDANDTTVARKSIRVDLALPTNRQLKWYYVEGTPAWAVAAAEAVGYEVEKLG